MKFDVAETMWAIGLCTAIILFGGEPDIADAIMKWIVK